VLLSLDRSSQLPCRCQSLRRNHAIHHHDDADARSTPNQNHPVRQNQNQVQSPPPREGNEGNGKDEGQKDPRPGREDENDNHLHSSAAVIPESRSYPASRSPSALRNSRAVGPGHSALALPLGSLYTEDSASRRDHCVLGISRFSQP